MNAAPLKPPPTRPPTKAHPLVSPTRGLTAITNTKNININNVNNADRLQNLDSTETGADHGLRETQGGSQIVARAADGGPDPGVVDPAGSSA